jgi:hypothetical protein
MEIETQPIERRLSPRNDLLASAAGMAVGLGCALAFPRPGLELISADNQRSMSPDEDQWYRPPGVRAIDLSDSGIEGSASPVYQHLDSLIANLFMPTSWRDEGIEEPSDDCKIYARTVFRRLFDQFGLIPYKTSISKDGGLYAAYRSACGRNTLRIEIDNELDAVAVVSDGAAILSSGLLEGDDDERSIVDALNRITA